MADPPPSARRRLLADETSQLLYLRDALMSGDARARRQALRLLEARAVARLVAAIDAALAES